MFVGMQYYSHKQADPAEVVVLSSGRSDEHPSCWVGNKQTVAATNGWTESVVLSRGRVM